MILQNKNLARREVANVGKSLEIRREISKIYI